MTLRKSNVNCLLMRKLNVAKSFVRVWRPHRVLLFLLRLLFHFCEHFFSHGKNFACSGRSKKTSKVDHHLEGGKTKIASNRTNRKKETAERMIELTSNTESTSSERSPQINLVR